MSVLIDNIKAVVFDLDDTLYPETRYVRSGFRIIAGSLAGRCDIAKPDDIHASAGGRTEMVFDLLWRAFEDGPREKVFNTVLKQLGQSDDPQVITELVDLYRCHRPGLRLEPSVRGLLDELRGKYKLGLLTDGFLPAQRLKVEALELEESFDCIIYTEQLGREFWKPSPRSFELMAEALACEHGQCAYIADNPAKDFLAPNRLGWQSVQVHRVDSVHAENTIPPQGRPQKVIKELTELLIDF